MSVTDELREYAQGWRETPNLMDDLDAGDVDGILADFEHIADRIDAEHEAKVAYWQGASYKDGYDEGFASADDLLAQHGWVRLPVDADGKVIHIGDVMEWPDGSTAEVVGIGPDTFFYVEDGEDAAEWSCASDKIHYHAPTVKDVLREFAMAVCKDDALTIRKDVVDQYAAKIRLANGEEER